MAFQQEKRIKQELSGTPNGAHLSLAQRHRLDDLARVFVLHLAHNLLQRLQPTPCRQAMGMRLAGKIRVALAGPRQGVLTAGSSGRK
jgi:hypothetical protein